MNKINALSVFLIAILLIITGCDPMQLVYLRNHTNENVNIKVFYQPKDRHDTTSIKVWYSHKIFEKINGKMFDSLTNVITVNNSYPDNYTVYIPANSTCRVGPIGLIGTIDKLLFNTGDYCDTINFFNENPLVLESGKKIKLTRQGISYFIIDYQ